MRPRSPYCAFHRDEHVLLQFILKESLDTLSLIKKLEAILEKDVKAVDLEKLKNLLCELAGGSFETLHFLVWPNGEGRLAKLKGYCTWLLKEAIEEDTPLFRLDRLSNEAWVYCMKSLDLLDQKPFKSYSLLALKKMCRTMGRFEKTLPDAISLYMHDENVLFFLIRHKKELDNVYHPGFTEELFSSFFNGKPEDGKKFLVDRYLARGFDTILPQIETFFCHL